MTPRDNLTKIIDINLEYLSEIEYNDIKQLEENSLERLLYIFVCEDKKKLDELYIGDVLMEKIKSKLYDLSSNIDDYFYYDKEELLKEESYSLGVEHGIKKGIKQGIEQEQADLINNMFLAGMSTDEIHKVTKIPLTTIQKVERK